MKKVAFIGILAGAHLVLVILGASQISLEPYGAVGSYIQMYGDLSGASSGYGFFAPGVGHQIRAQFDVTDAKGNQKVTSLLSGSSKEADLRTGNIVTSFKSNAAQEKRRRALVASWAGKVFAREPQAEEVVVRLESYSPVSLKQYREGKRSEWKPYYRAKFVRKAQ